jgi:putative nucleotide binding protein
VFSLESTGQPRKYEEYAYVLDVTIRGRSNTIRRREGTIVQAIGEEQLTLLELLSVPNAPFDLGERVYIGKDGRDKIISVLGRLDYSAISVTAKSELPLTIEKIVKTNEKRFIDYFNNAQPINPRIHSLQLIPGIGKTYLMSILQEREKKTFESFDDLQSRIGLRDPAKLVGRRIVEEISGGARMNIFVRR